MIERAERVAAVRSDAAADKATVRSGLVAVRELRAWCDAQHAGLVSQLAAVDSFPEAMIAAADKTSVGKASKSTERAGTLAATPTLADALGDGAITAGHVDAVTRAGKQLDESQRAELFDRVDDLTREHRLVHRRDDLRSLLPEHLGRGFAEQVGRVAAEQSGHGGVEEGVAEVGVLDEDRVLR